MFCVRWIAVCPSEKLAFSPVNHPRWSDSPPGQIKDSFIETGSISKSCNLPALYTKEEFVLIWIFADNFWRPQILWNGSHCKWRFLAILGWKSLWRWKRRFALTRKEAIFPLYEMMYSKVFLRVEHISFLSSPPPAEWCFCLSLRRLIRAMGWPLLLGLFLTLLPQDASATVVFFSPQRH